MKFEHEALDSRDWNMLVACFTHLPETYRAVLEMRLLLGYSTSEIAQILGMSPAAAEKRLARGRKLLQEIVQKEGFEP